MNDECGIRGHPPNLYCSTEARQVIDQALEAFNCNHLIDESHYDVENILRSRLPQLTLRGMASFLLSRALVMRGSSLHWKIWMVRLSSKLLLL